MRFVVNMLAFNSLLLIIIIINNLANVSANDEFDENDLTEENALNQPIKIDKDSFLDVINEPEVGTLVMFYAPWCGHCKRMVSTWSQLARKHNKNNKFLIAKVDCADQTELCSDNDVLGYPTFLYFKKKLPTGQFYDGKRDLESIEAFLYSNYIHDSENLDEKTDEAEAKEEPKQAVYELNDNDFQQFISKGYHFIKFYAPWCGHCQRLAPIWEELGQKYIDSDIKLSKVDCTKSSSICNSNQIRGYPTLVFFHDGKMIKQYDRQRTIEEFSNFIDELVQNNDKKLTQREEKTQHLETPTGEVVELTDTNFDAYMQKRGLLFVKFFAPWCSHCQAMAQTWKDLALKFQDNNMVEIAEVDCTNSVELCMNQHIEGYPTLILFKEGYKLKDYLGDRSLNAFEDFLNSYLKHEDL